MTLHHSALMLISLSIATVMFTPAHLSAEPSRMMVNHGQGWVAAGDFPTPKQCEQEAADYAIKHKAQAGCAPVSAIIRWHTEAQFQQVARGCATDANVELVAKPGAKVTILGTARQRFEFDRCMAERGQALEGTK